MRPSPEHPPAPRQSFSRSPETGVGEAENCQAALSAPAASTSAEAQPGTAHSASASPNTGDASTANVGTARPNSEGPEARARETGVSDRNGLEARNVTVRFGRRTVLHNVTAGPFTRGTIHALLGPNGSGKSTLLRAMAGLLPSSACVTLNGEDLSAMSLTARTRKCLYLPQDLPAPVHLPVLEALMAASHTGGGVLQAPQQDDAVRDALDRLTQFGIAPLALRPLDELSGGQRQLVGLAQAFSRTPEAVLLDEPLSALDLHHQFAVMTVLRRETTARQLVTVIVLHDLNIALNLTDTVTVLHEGHIMASGPPADVLTPALLRETYRIRARIEHGADGRSFVSVDGIA